MARFDGLAVVHAVTELTHLLDRRTSLSAFLHDVVRTVAEHMGAEVCSVYLYDVEQDVLVMRATHGLNPELIDKVRLRSGEGLTGAAFRTNQPILVRDVGDSSDNKVIPDLGEERFPAFLGIPIKRGDLGIGVITLQQRDPAILTGAMTRALRAIASYLAATLENAAALYEARETRTNDGSARRTEQFRGLLNGISASRGIAIGKAQFLSRPHVYRDATPSRDLDAAIGASTDQLVHLQKQVDETLSDVAALIFSSHLLMLRDDSFVGEMRRRHSDGTSATEAVKGVVDEFSARFAAIPDPRFQEKVLDVRDLGLRIVRNLYDLSEERRGDYSGNVLIARELFPSELVKLYLQNTAGLVFAGGTAAGHIAILAASLDLPVVSTADPRLFEIAADAVVVVDAEDGKVLVDPASEVMDVYRERVVRAKTSSERVGPIPAQPCLADGTEYRLLANVNLVKDARAAESFGLAGIGLYRSEFPFLIRNGFPDEEEQCAVYRRIVAAVPGKPVAFRTLDLGGDKLLSSQVGREDNPFLGFRGIRFVLAHRELFREQLRAMLRAGHGRAIGIIFPMIAGVEELRAARAEVEACVRELHEERSEHNRSPRLGVMVELPAAIEMAAELAAEADFLSIGTNDLTMYILAADRNNHRVAPLYRSIHPATLRAVKRVTQAAHAAQCEVSVCGDSASDPILAMYYLGLGITTLSVNPTRAAELVTALGQVGTEQIRDLCRKLEACTSAEEIAELAVPLRNRLLPEPRS